MANIRIPSTSITKQPRIVIAKGSKDEYFLDSSQYVTIEENDVKILTEEVAENFVAGQTFNIPQLEDIEVFSSTTYLDEKGVIKAKLIFKVRNSSGKNLLGVDCRVANS